MHLGDVVHRCITNRGDIHISIIALQKVDENESSV